MKKFTFAIFILLIVSFGLKSQNNRDQAPPTIPASEHTDSIREKLKSAYEWKINPRLGERIMIDRDTATMNFHRSSIVDGQDIAVSYLGNIGTPSQSKIFFNRPDDLRFTFLNGLQYYRKGPENHQFLNTKVPYSNIYYQTGGGGESQEEHFKTTLSSNFGKKINAGFDFDYLYARGFYTNLYNRQVNYDFFASYIGDKYQMHAFAGNNNFRNAENGGITDPLYITNPNSDIINTPNRFSGDPKDIPTQIPNGQHLWNRLRGRHIYVTNRYNLGDDMEEYAVNDSVNRWRKKENYISPASVILTTHYNDQRRQIISDANTNQLDQLYLPYRENLGSTSDKMRYPGTLDDYMAFYSIKNTLALTMNEGFRSWTKFGLTAFAEYDYSKFSLPTLAFQGVNRRENENSFVVGGILSKEQGKYLKYKVTAEKDFLNSDYRLQGEVETMFNLINRDISAKAKAYIKSVRPGFFDKQFTSKYWAWDNDFSNIERRYIGGEIEIPTTKTKISGGYENLQNYIYYGANRLPDQKTGTVSILTLQLDQKLESGIFHWDNQIAFQATSDKEVIPLPQLTAYTNIYLKTKVAKVLTLQLGVDAYFHTKYKVPGYEPLTMQFYNQDSDNIGAFPIATVYANLHLKYTRFFIMMYNVADGIGNSEYFSSYRYPVAPRTIKFGLSWNFNN